MLEVTWRDPRPEDREILLEVQRRQNLVLEKMGIEPRLYDLTHPENHPPLVYARVAEKNGQVVGCFYGLINIEIETVADDKEVYQSLPDEIRKMALHFKPQGIETARGFVPRRRARFMEKVLAPFKQIQRQKTLDHFFCDFRQVSE